MKVALAWYYDGSKASHSESEALALLLRPLLDRELIWVDLTDEEYELFCRAIWDYSSGSHRIVSNNRSCLLKPLVFRISEPLEIKDLIRDAREFLRKEKKEREETERKEQARKDKYAAGALKRKEKRLAKLKKELGEV